MEELATLTALDSGERGGLLLEVLAALLILSFAFLAIAPMFVFGAQLNATSGDLTFAGVVALDLAEEVAGTGYNDLTPGTRDDVVRMHALRYERRVVVEADTPQFGLKTVTITVRPARRGGTGPSTTARVSIIRAPL